MVKRMTWIERVSKLPERKCVTHQFNQFRQHAPVTGVRRPGDVVVYLHGILAEGIALEHLGDAVDVEPSIPSLFMSHSRLNWTLDGLVDALDSFWKTIRGTELAFIWWVILLADRSRGAISRPARTIESADHMYGYTPPGDCTKLFRLGWL